MSRPIKYDRNRIIKLLLAGSTTKEIEIEFVGISQALISLLRKRAGIPSQKRGRKCGSITNFLAYEKLPELVKTMNLRQAGELMNISHQRVCQILSPEKHRARKMLADYVKLGKVIKPKSCSECGALGNSIQAHHNDYSKPLEVIWLCSKCHGLKRKNIKQISRRFIC